MEEEIMEILNGIDRNLLGILITSFIAFICWLVKGLIEVPLMSSKEIFFRHFEKRIGVLGDIKIRLVLIADFPGEEGKYYKEQLQEILLRDGNAAYLDSDILAQIMDISITPVTNEKSLIKAVNTVNIALASYIGKVEQSNNFYSKYANVDPVKRISGYLLLSLYYVFVIVLLLLFIGISGYFFITGGASIKALVILVFFSLILLLNKWQNNI